MYGSVSNTTPGGRTGFVLRNGLIYDGSGHPPRRGDVWIDGSTIMAASGGEVARAATEVDVDGLAVAPGFINVLSWATESLIEDGASQSDIRQGVTLEVFGEGLSMGPLTPAMQREMLERQGDIRYPCHLEHARGVSRVVGPARRVDQCRFIHRRYDGADQRRRLCRPASDRRRAGQDV